ncbi:MAG: polymer-forming cytoskeletal protein [Agarilytica sp.]
MLNHRSEAKHEEPKVFPVENSAPLRQRQETPTPASPTAVIGPKIRFKGELVGEEDLLVQGQVEGTIDLKGHNLTVGEQGTLLANVTAKTITVEGKVQGDLHGEERIAIRSSSNVQGNIKAERVVLEDGAKFRGSIDMDMGDSSDVKAMASQLKETDEKHEKPAKKPE